jgi:hypothetical protein
MPIKLEFGFPPVRISSCTTTTIGLEIKKLKSIILKVMIYTAPSPVQCAHEGIHSPMCSVVDKSFFSSSLQYTIHIMQ